MADFTSGASAAFLPNKPHPFQRMKQWIVEYDLQVNGEQLLDQEMYVYGIDLWAALNEAEDKLCSGLLDQLPTDKYNEIYYDIWSICQVEEGTETGLNDKDKEHEHGTQTED